MSAAEKCMLNMKSSCFAYNNCSLKLLSDVPSGHRPHVLHLYHCSELVKCMGRAGSRSAADCATQIQRSTKWEYRWLEENEKKSTVHLVVMSLCSLSINVSPNVNQRCQSAFPPSNLGRLL